MSGGDAYMAERMLRKGEVAMPRELSEGLYRRLPDSLRDVVKHKFAAALYEALVAAYQDGRG